MCGLVAVFRASGPADGAAISRAVEQLRHRGPDAQTVWLDPQGLAGLGHARLGLLDLSPAGQQPLHAADGRAHVVVNGEFYGFEAQKAALQSRGHAFSSSSDSEILLPLYAEYRAAAVEQLRGEFAFVIWDSAQRTITAGRDRFGIKPLFYALHAGDLYLASEVKALFALGIEPAWDEEAVYDYHRSWMIHAGRTLYRGVYQVPPGHLLTAKAGAGPLQPRLKPYWDLQLPLLAADLAQAFDPAEAALALRAKLDEAVRLRLRADVPVACYLSGGLDSSAVLGIAARHASQPLHAFTVAFDGPAAYDETAAAQASARAAGAIHHQVRMSSSCIAEHFSSAIGNAELPFVNANGVAKFLLSRAASQAGFKAVLTGEGADEVFGGYLHFRRDALLARHDPRQGERLAALAAADPVARAMMLLTGEAPASVAAVGAQLGFVPTFIATHGHGTDRATALLNHGFRQRFAGRATWQHWLEQLDLAGQVYGRSQLNQSLYLWTKSMLPQYLLPILGDRAEMAHAVEGRLPFLDHELVAFASSLPTACKIAPDLTEKHLLREAARPYISDEVRSRQKQPFLAPPLASVPGSPLYARLRDTCAAQDFAAQPFYDQGSVLNLLDAAATMAPEPQAQADIQLMNILSFSVLGREMGISR